MIYDSRLTIWLRRFVAVVPIASSFCVTYPALGQGALTPPGPPAPTMKSLGQIEPRIPISSAPFTITQPGSYYLTTNLTATVSNAIVIAASGVTLDLGGWTIASTAPNAGSGGSAILLNSGVSDVTVCNGHIVSGVTNNGSGVYSGSGFANGITASGVSTVNVLVSRVSVSGCLFYGIYLGNGTSTVVESCTLRTIGAYGIVAATVKESSALDCGVFAIGGDVVSDCEGQSSGAGHAIFATTALNCYGSGVSGDGIDAEWIASGCVGFSTSGSGVTAYIANSCYSSTGDSGITHPYNMP